MIHAENAAPSPIAIPFLWTAKDGERVVAEFEIAGAELRLIAAPNGQERGAMRVAIGGGRFAETAVFDAEFVRQALSLANGTAGSGAPLPEEIERAFLVQEGSVSETPKAIHEIEQGYLAGGLRLRIRQTVGGATQAFATLKGAANGAARMELESEVERGFARLAIDGAAKKSLVKTRRVVEHAGRDWEVDAFHGPLESLWRAEVELASADAKVELPAWAGPEVTGVPEFENGSLAKLPSPPDCSALWKAWREAKAGGRRGPGF
jgi:adenylate cyclase